MSRKTESGPRRGRPPLAEAESHAAILDAVYELLKKHSVRDLTMEAVAKRAKVGKPTLYKWWPTKAELVLAMFRERILSAHPPPPVPGETAEEAISHAACLLIRAFDGPLGKVSAELIAEGQSEPEIMRKWFDEHIRYRRARNAEDIERGKASGELLASTNPQLVIDSIFGAIYYRLLFRYAPLTEEFGKDVVAQVFRGLRARQS
jgi:AcrR family transcriptional regulator